MTSSNVNPTEILTKIHKGPSSGLLYIHTRINANTNKNIEAASFLYALIEILSEKGLLTIEELDERKKQVAQRLVKRIVDSGMGLMYQDPEYDKYTFDQKRMLTARAGWIFEKLFAASFHIPFPGRGI